LSNKSKINKVIFALIILIIFQNCSFDNKSGIWKNENLPTKAENDLFKEFENLSSINYSFDKIVPLKKNFKFKISNSINSNEWLDIFYDSTNNFNNLNYNGTGNLIFKSKRITKYRSNEYILFEKGKIISADNKGNLIIFSIDKNKIFKKFNFYKKKYKNINKKLNLIIDNNIIYVSDNLGYLYAYDYKIDKVLWAKNYKIPFRSNIKLIKDKLATSNQNNDLYFFDKNSGDVLKLIPTEETVVQNKFINNLSVLDGNLFFLNTYGSLYGIDINTMRVNWFVNLNQSMNINPSNLFEGNQIIARKNVIVVTSSKFTYLLDINLGTVIYKKNFTSLTKPIINNEYLFTITNNNLLIAMNLINGEIIYSYDINEKIASFLDIKKEKVKIKNLMIINNKLFIFLKNSYLLKFNINGNIEAVEKFKDKIYSQPIFVNESLLYLNKKNKILIIN
jgi:hypothetical protein